MISLDSYLRSVWLMVDYLEVKNGGNKSQRNKHLVNPVKRFLPHYHIIYTLNHETTGVTPVSYLQIKERR